MHHMCDNSSCIQDECLQRSHLGCCPLDSEVLTLQIHTYICRQLLNDKSHHFTMKIRHHGGEPFYVHGIGCAVCASSWVRVLVLLFPAQASQFRSVKVRQCKLPVKIL